MAAVSAAAEQQSREAAAAARAADFPSLPLAGRPAERLGTGIFIPATQPRSNAADQGNVLVCACPFYVHVTTRPGLLIAVRAGCSLAMHTVWAY